MSHVCKPSCNVIRKTAPLSWMVRFAQLLLPTNLPVRAAKNIWITLGFLFSPEKTHNKNSYSEKKVFNICRVFLGHFVVVEAHLTELLLPQFEVSSSGSALLGAVSQHISADSQGGRVVGWLGWVFPTRWNLEPLGVGATIFFSPQEALKNNLPPCEELFFLG